MTVPRELVEGPIYLDDNAITPVDPAVTEAMLPYLTGGFGIPSSDHLYGRAPRAALEHARTQVAVLLGVQDGQVDPAALAAAFTDRTVLVSIMAANNEAGAPQPIPDLARITHEHGAVFHTDAGLTAVTAAILPFVAGTGFLLSIAVDRLPHVLRPTSTHRIPCTVDSRPDPVIRPMFTHGRILSAWIATPCIASWRTPATSSTAFSLPPRRRICGGRRTAPGGPISNCCSTCCSDISSCGH